MTSVLQQLGQSKQLPHLLSQIRKIKNQFFVVPVSESRPFLYERVKLLGYPNDFQTNNFQQYSTSKVNFLLMQ